MRITSLAVAGVLALSMSACSAFSEGGSAPKRSTSTTRSTSTGMLAVTRYACQRAPFVSRTHSTPLLSA